MAQERNEEGPAAVDGVETSPEYPAFAVFLLVVGNDSPSEVEQAHDISISQIMLLQSRKDEVV
jgi:hypothetical protein